MRYGTISTWVGRISRICSCPCCCICCACCWLAALVGLMLHVDIREAIAAGLVATFAALIGWMTWRDSSDDAPVRRILMTAGAVLVAVIIGACYLMYGDGD